MPSADLDDLEVVAILLEKSTWDIFRELCENRPIKAKETEHLWDAWVHEDFLTDWMQKSLKIIITRTTWSQTGGAPPMA